MYQEIMSHEYTTEHIKLYAALQIYNGGIGVRFDEHYHSCCLLTCKMRSL